MKQGTLELTLFGVTFLALQFWYIKMSLKNIKNEIGKNIPEDQLDQKKKRLEKLLKQ